MKRSVRTEMSPHPGIHPRTEYVLMGRRDHGAHGLFAQAHVAGDRAAALAHAVDLALLDLQTRREGGVGDDVGGLGDDDEA